MRIKKRKIGFFSVIFGILGIGFSALCIFLALTNTEAKPILVEQPQAAKEQVRTMLDALCEGDYDTVSGCLYGTPGLGLDREAEDAVGRLFWDAISESFSYELVGDFHATDSGVAVKATISAMDLSSVTANLRERAQQLLEQRIAEAHDPSEIYDANNEFKEEFVMGALYDAAQDALAQDARQITWDVTLNLIYENGQWWIMPEQNLLSAISGGILK